MGTMKEGMKLKGVLEIFERKIGEKDWRKIREVENIITNVGYKSIANRLTGDGSLSSVTYTHFSISNGTVTPTLTRTAADFLSDGTTFEKVVESFEGFSTPQLMQQWNCFLATTENTVASITKFALMDALSPTNMFNEVKFDAISKDSTKEFYFRYKLYMTQS